MKPTSWRMRFTDEAELFTELAILLDGKETSRERKIFSESRGGEALSAQKELNFWMVRMGQGLEAGLPMSRIGIYTDFT